ncbi:MAG: DUF1998 domain-containing protein, partial [Gammaproteobacteria bacterium]|nr:DUF1998 domain-containing protein [Gammaproteobacteria bacterium]
LVWRITGYKKIRYYTHENVGYGKINLPDQEMHTTAVWWQVSPEILEDNFPSRWQALDGFLGAAHAMHFVAALLVMSEPKDLGRAVGNGDARWFATVGANGRGQIKDFKGESTELEGDRFQPTVFLYDNYPGGIGLSSPLFDLRSRIVQQSATMVEACNCAHGCPACIGPVLPSDSERGHSPKSAAIVVLKLLALDIDD